MSGAVRRGFLFVAVACACGALAPAAYATLSVPDAGHGTAFPSLAAFTAAARGADNGTAVGEQGNGYRHVTWIGVAADGSDPGSTVIATGRVAALPRSRLQPWGLDFASDVAVANDGFTSVNLIASGLSGTPISWAPFNSYTTALQVVAPTAQASMPVAAQTRGLGVTFLNVKAANTTGIQYFDGDIPLGQAFAPIGNTSFAGMLFPDAVVTRVVITLGSASIFSFDGSKHTQGGTDPSTLVAGEDLALAEPAPAPGVATTAGVPVTSLLDTFIEITPGATPRATIDWGDGTRTAGTIAPGAGGTSVVAGDHAYAETGSFTAKVTVDDSGGPEQTSQTQIQVGLRASTVSVTCSPSPVAVTAATVCTAAVADAGAGGPMTPTGTVAFSSPTAGASFATDSGCVLGATETPGVAICEVQFTPTQLPPMQARINASYIGDDAHAGSSDTAIVGVRAQRCKLKALPGTLKAHPAVLGILVTCDARANVTIAVNATGARKGRIKAFTIPFGNLRTTVGGGRPTVLVIRPSRAVVDDLRTAGRRGQRVALKLTLTATSHATRATTTTGVAAVRIR
jgi:hypothetical protein